MTNQTKIPDDIVKEAKELAKEAKRKLKEYFDWLEESCRVK